MDWQHSRVAVDGLRDVYVRTLNALEYGQVLDALQSLDPSASGQIKFMGITVAKCAVTGAGERLFESDGAALAELQFRDLKLIADSALKLNGLTTEPIEVVQGN